jgi:hypothetical protein
VHFSKIKKLLYLSQFYLVLRQNIDYVLKKLLEIVMKTIFVSKPLCKRRESFMIKKRVLLFSLLIMGALTGMRMQASNAAASACCPTTTCNSNASCACPCGAKTYFANLPLFQSYRPELWTSFRNDRMLAESCGWGGVLDIVVYGGQSTNPDQLAAYFLPGCKQRLAVSELLNPTAAAATPASEYADIMAQHFNIVTVDGSQLTPTGGFRSDVCFRARHSEAGVGLHWKQGFLFNNDKSKWWYLDINLPLTWVKNKMEIGETIISDGGGVNEALSNDPAVVDMTTAFRQAGWRFGKIDCRCNRTKFGVADIELKFGRQWWSDCCNAAGYIGVLIPTGNRPNGCYVFEPVVGHGGSAALMFGSEGGYEIWSSCNNNWHLSWAWAAQGMYLFGRCQTRSFDLKNKPWSRYQEVYANQAQAAEAAALGGLGTRGQYLSTPGINVFTQCMKVTPGVWSNATTSFIVESECGFAGELGYNLLARQSECVDLNWTEGPALKHTFGSGQTTVVRDITPSPYLNGAATVVALENYDYSVIHKADLDLQSAAHPAGLVHLVYGSLGWVYDCKFPSYFTVGGSYEFPYHDYSVMKRWTVWGKVGVTF